MKRKTYLINSPKAIGLYFSRNLALYEVERLQKYGPCLREFEDYESAKSFLFSQYEHDPEIDLEKFHVNRLIWRDVSKRYNFYVETAKIIGYGISYVDREIFLNWHGAHWEDIKEVDSTEQAEFYVRRRLAEINGNVSYLDHREIYPGEAIFI